MKKHEQRFYVYVLARPNGTPFYVGKGQRERVFDHEKEAQNGHRCHKCNVIRKILRSGGEVQRYIVFTTDDEAEALTVESEVIAMHGRKSLTNQCDGGQGASGSLHSGAARLRHSAVTKANWNNPDYRANMIAKVLASWKNPERRAIAVAKMQASWDAERRAAASVSRKELWKDPAYRAKVTEGNKASHNTPEHLSGLRDRTTALWKNPSYRAKMKSAVEKVWSDPERRAAAAAKRREQWKDPDYRAKVIAGLKATGERKRLARITPHLPVQLRLPGLQDEQSD